MTETGDGKNNYERDHISKKKKKIQSSKYICAQILPLFKNQEHAPALLEWTFEMNERKTVNRDRDTDEKRKANHDYDSIKKCNGELDLRNSNFFPIAN